MKILWLSLYMGSVDWAKKGRVEYGINDPLITEIKKIGQVDVIKRKINERPGLWQNKWAVGVRKPESLVDVKKANEYDVIVVGVPFVFMEEDWSNIKALKVVQIEDQHGIVPTFTKRLQNMGFSILYQLLLISGGNNGWTSIKKCSS